MYSSYIQAFLNQNLSASRPVRSSCWDLLDQLGIRNRKVTCVGSGTQRDLDNETADIAVASVRCSIHRLSLPLATDGLHGPIL